MSTSMSSGLHRLVALLSLIAVFTAGQGAGLCMARDCSAGRSTPHQWQTRPDGCHQRGAPAKHDPAQNPTCKHQLVATDRVEKASAKITLDAIALFHHAPANLFEIVVDLQAGL